MVIACLFAHTVWPVPEGLASSGKGPRPDVGSWPDSGRKSGSRDRSDVGGRLDVGEGEGRTLGLSEWGQSDTTG